MDCMMSFLEHSKCEVYEVNHGSLMPSGAHYILIIPIQCVMPCGIHCI